MMEPMKCRIGSAGAKNRTLVLQRSNLLVFPKNRSKVSPAFLGCACVRARVVDPETNY
jgi:hypothetical protein